MHLGLTFLLKRNVIRQRREPDYEGLIKSPMDLYMASNLCLLLLACLIFPKALIVHRGPTAGPRDMPGSEMDK